ncbi:MAG: helix-turn-helix domain-containing protein [Desulfurococcaceae archaeon]
MVSKRNPEKLVLSIVARYKQCNFNTLKKETGLSYYTLTRSIERLISKGLITEKRVGRLRIIKITENQ